MDTATRKRTATPDRWALALRRAHENGVACFQISDTGEWVATSTSKPGTVYRTDGISCGCPAGLANDPICTHRAAFWAVQGVICLAGSHDPAPVPPASDTVADVVAFLSPAQICPTCNDTGRVVTDGFDGRDVQPCWVCTKAAS